MSPAAALATVVVGAVVLYAFCLLCFRHGLRRTAAAGGEGAQPAVSVIVAARDEADHVEACLRGLADQTYPSDRYEVILVDDGSRDGTGVRARHAAAALGSRGLQVRVLDGPAAYGCSGSKKAALSLAIQVSVGELILTTDADCTVPATWVATMAAALADGVGAVVGFSQIGAPGQPLRGLAAWEGFDFLLMMAAAVASCALGHPMSASGQSLGFRRAAFDEVGGYRSVMHRVSGDDVLLLQLIRRSGRWRLRCCSDTGARVVHPPSPGLVSFLNRRARWASNAPLQLRLDPLFFFVLVVILVASGCCLAAPVLWLAGVLPGAAVLAAWGVKIAGEGAFAQAAARRFGRPELLAVFLPWTLLQPFYTIVVGGLGSVGLFRWKGRTATLGRTRSRPKSQV